MVLALLALACPAPAPSSGLVVEAAQPGIVPDDSGLPYVMIRVPPGKTWMGGPVGERGRTLGEALHEVRITRPYFIGATEVTRGLWKAVMGQDPSSFTACGPRCPVEGTSWLDAVRFCNALSLIEGLEPAYQIEDSPDPERAEDVRVVWLKRSTGYRLPTEAEWEYAARIGDGAIGGGMSEDLLSSLAWYGANSGGHPWPVGQKKPSPLGLFDMAGNVREWTWDWWAPHSEHAVRDPEGPPSGWDRVIKGGGWESPPERLRTGARDGARPDYRDEAQGFRLARSE